MFEYGLVNSMFYEKLAVLLVLIHIMNTTEDHVLRVI